MKPNFKFLSDSKHINRLFNENKEAINEYNIWFLKHALIVSCYLLVLAIISNYVRSGSNLAYWGFGVALAIAMVILIILKAKKDIKHLHHLIFICFNGAYILALYLSVVCFPERYATTILVYYCMTPFIFIIKPRYRNISIFISYALQLILTIIFKEPELAKSDIMNCFIGMALGLTIGRIILSERLDNFNIKRELVLEKETDVLTGIYNRRKLFSDVERIGRESSRKPNAVFMIDFDDFKAINDEFGHLNGDFCLKKFGEALISLQSDGYSSFYRYGGEEFLGFIYYSDDNFIKNFAEIIRNEVNEIVICNKKITISIGCVLCKEKDINYETWIKRADDAVYFAKNRGKNMIGLYQEEGKVAIISNNDNKKILSA